MKNVVIEKLSCKDTLRQLFVCLRPRTPYHPYTLCIRVYSNLIHTGKGGGAGVELNQREG